VLELLDLRRRGERLEATRLEIDPTVVDTVAGILQRVFVEGDDVLIELCQRFDGADMSGSGILVTETELDAAERDTPTELCEAIDELIDRLRDLHARQLPQEWREQRDGVRFGEIVRPLHSVGCYVPGGRAVYPSSVCMTVVPAVVAGVEEIVVCTPPQSDGSIPSPVLYAARRAGATHVAKTGGAQAVGAMAYGTESIPRVDRIVGPGNAYVTEAKRQVAGFVGIDGLAGPSELAIVADGEVDVRLAALDLIAQAEHDPQARTFFVTTSPDVVEAVSVALDDELASAGRREIIDMSLRFTKAVLVRDLEQAAEVVNDLASEHLLILLPDPESFLATVRNAGAIFLGPATAVPFGDYGVASNHVLPTAGTARFSSGLRASDYVTVSSVVEMSREAAGRYAAQAARIAEAEGLVGHARAMESRAAARQAPPAEIGRSEQ
jgi:histidinol dehydrogenase